MEGDFVCESLPRVGLTLVGWMEARVKRGIWRLLLVSLPLSILHLCGEESVDADDDILGWGGAPS
jgi:hypothetical protein